MSDAAVGRYELRGEIARGAQGVVYRAWDPETQREVALKALTTHGGDLEARRLGRERQALLRLRHPNLVAVLDGGQLPNGTPYLVMELVEGRSLDERLRTGALDQEQAVHMTLELARALAHAHSQGVVHRDVKPDNVLLDSEGRPRLTDFGLAKLTSSPELSKLSRTGHCLGSPGYWPPEQANGELDRIGPHSDVYGLGATLYAMLTGAPPATGETLAELIIRSEQPAAPPSELRPDLDPRLDAICLRCLAANPGDRYPHAGVLEQALEAYLESPTPAPRPSAWPARVAAGLVVLGLTATACIITRPRPPAAPTPVPPSAKLLAEAQRHADAQDPLATLGACERLLELDPGHPQARRLQAQALIQLTRPLEATEVCLAEIQRDPQSVTWRQQLASAHCAAFDYQAALEVLGRALELNPSPALRAEIDEHRHALEVYARAAQVADLRRGREELERVLTSQRPPNAHRGQILLAQHHGKAGDLELALHVADQAMTSGPHDPESYLVRGRILGALGDVEGAQQHYQESKRRLAALPPAEQKRLHRLRRLIESIQNLFGETEPTASSQEVDQLLGRARDHAIAGRWEECLAAYDAALALTPNQAAAHTGRADALLQLGRGVDALSAATRATELSSLLPHAWHMRGRVLRLLNREDEAVPLFEHALTLLGEQDHEGLGATRLELRICVGFQAARRALEAEDYPLAIAALTRVLEEAPGEIRAFYMRAHARLRTGDVDGSLADLDAMIEGAPADPRGWLRRGSLHAMRGDDARAQADLEQALRLSDDHPSLQTAASEALQRYR